MQNKNDDEYDYLFKIVLIGESLIYYRDLQEMNLIQIQKQPLGQNLQQDL